MPDEGLKQRLTAILSADVKDYSRLLSQDRVSTVRTLNDHREIFTNFIQQYGGRVVDMPGDNILAFLESVSDAVNCAVEIQRELAERNAEVPSARMMQWRIGVNLGDVMEEDGKVYGDGINIAARVEGLAEAGGICVSGRVFDQVHGKLGLEYESLGEQTVKNIADTIRVYRVLSYPGAAAHRVVKARVDATRNWHRVTLAVIVVAVLCVGSVLIWNNVRRPETAPESVLPEATVAPAAEYESTVTEKPSIAVLPFDNMSGDPDQEYFVDGMIEEIISRLSMTPLLNVLARNSTFHYKGKQLKVSQIGRELAAKYVVEGSVRRSGNTIRITAQLIEAEKETHLWARTYSGELEDVFALQDEIAQQIVTALNLEFTTAEMERIRRIATQNLTAYDSVLKGWSYTFLRTKEDNDNARRMFERAIELDPDYALAYAGLGMTYYLDRVFIWDTDPGVLEQAQKFAQRAVLIDDTLASAHMVLAQVYNFGGQYGQAMLEAERGLSLNPNDPGMHFTMGLVLTGIGRSEEAVDYIKKAMFLDPHGSSDIHKMALAYAYAISRQYERAIATYREALHQYPDVSGFRYGLVLTHRLAGQYAKAVALAKESLLKFPDDVGLRYEMSWSYLMQWDMQHTGDSGVLDEALRTARESVTLAESYPSGKHLICLVHLARGDYDLAADTAEELVQIGQGWYALKGHVRNIVGQPEDAVQLAERALRTNPRDNGALGVLALAYRLSGRHTESVDAYRQILDSHPQNSDTYRAHLNLAIIHTQMDRIATARAHAAEVLKLVPHFSVDVWGERNPMKDREQVERDMEALRKAGLK